MVFILICFPVQSEITHPYRIVASSIKAYETPALERECLSDHSSGSSSISSFLRLKEIPSVEEVRNAYLVLKNFRFLDITSTINVINLTRPSLMTYFNSLFLVLNNDFVDSLVVLTTYTLMFLV